MASKNKSEDTIKRWTAKRRTALVLKILKGETTAQEAAREHGLKVADVLEWKDLFLSGAENALRSRPRDEEAFKDHQIKKLKEKVGEMVLDIDIMREAIRLRPLGEKTLRELDSKLRAYHSGGSVESSE